MKKIISLLSLLLGFLLLISIPAYAETSFHWYCVRNRDHKQPRADTNMQFVEQYNGYYVDPQHGDQNPDKILYLTFDVGYENGNVAKILDILKEKQTPGAFFILGNLIKRNPELVQRMAQEGHIVGNHTTNHQDITKYSTAEEMKQDLEALEQMYFETTGQTMSKFFRPPEGTFDLRSMQFANELGYQTIFWSIAYADWDNAKQPSEEFAMAKIMDHIHNGAILLLHPTSSTNVKILGRLIDDLTNLGYRFAPLSELNSR